MNALREGEGEGGRGGTNPGAVEQSGRERDGRHAGRARAAQREAQLALLVRRRRARRRLVVELQPLARRLRLGAHLSGARAATVLLSPEAERQSIQWATIIARLLVAYSYSLYCTALIIQVYA